MTSHPSTGLRRLAGLMIAVVCGCAAAADVVTLKDGSRLVGTIKQLADGKLTMATAFAEALELDAALIAGIETEQRVELEKADQERLAGQLSWNAGQQQTLVRTQTGAQSVPVADIAMLWPEGTPSPAEIAKAAAEEAKKPKWTTTIELGASATEGNSDTLDARGKILAEMKAEKDLLQLFISGDYGEQNDIRSRSEARTGAYYEHIFTDRLFGYARAEAEYDEFENIALRFVGAAGPGYYWIKEEKHELKTRAGLGYQYEEYIDPESTSDKLGLDIGLDYRLDIADWLRFTNSTTYFPTFEELRDYRLESDFALLMPIADSEIWKFKVGAKFEYDPIPAFGFERLDQTYYVNLVAVLK